MNANRSAIPSFVIRSLARLSILLVQTAWRHPARGNRERLVDAWIKPGMIGDMGAVIGKIVGEQTLDLLRIERSARCGEAAHDQRPRAGPEQRAGAFDGQGRKALSSQQVIEGGDQILGRVGERAVEIIDNGRSEHRIRSRNPVWPG